MYSYRLHTHNKSTNTDPEVNKAESVVYKRKNIRSNIPSATINEEDRKIIEGWSMQIDTQQCSHSMLHTLSRNIRSYQKMQRKLSERRNLRQIKHQYKNIRTTCTSRLQSARRKKGLSNTKINVEGELTDIILKQRRISRKQPILDLLKNFSKNKDILKKRSKIKQQMSYFNELRQTNQKKIRSTRYDKQNQNTSQSLIKRTKLYHQNHLSKNIKTLQQKLKQIVDSKNSRFIKTPIIDISISTKEINKNNQTQRIYMNSRNKISQRSKSPTFRYNSYLYDNQFQDSKIFNKIR